MCCGGSKMGSWRGRKNSSGVADKDGSMFLFYTVTPGNIIGAFAAWYFYQGDIFNWIPILVIIAGWEIGNIIYNQYWGLMPINKPD